MKWTPGRIFELRIKHNLSQEAMAREAGMSLATWRRLEHGYNAPGFQSQAKLDKLERQLTDEIIGPKD